MTQNYRFSTKLGGIPESEIEKLKKLRQVLDNQAMPSAGKLGLSQERVTVADKRFCRKAKKVPRFNSNLPFLTIEGEKIYIPPSCVSLSKLAAIANYNASTCFVLSWPAVTDHPSLAHVIATLSFYSIYKDQELRTLYWPAKTNAMDYLRRLCIDAQWLREIAAQVATARDRKRATNPGIIQFREKTLALLRLDDYTKKRTTPLALSEYISAYHYKNDGSWIRRPDGLLKSVVKEARQYKKKGMIREYAKKLNRPEVAVDSLFCLHPEMDLVALKNCLQSPVFDLNQGGMPPNLVFFDLRSANRFQTDKWFQKAQHLFQHFQGKDTPAPTGFVVLVDSPLVYANLRRYYENWHFPQDIALERYQPKFAALVDTLGHGLGQWSSQIASPDRGKATVGHQASLGFRIQVTDYQTTLLVNQFLDLAKEVSVFSHRAKNALNDVARTLSYISMLPGGMQALETWLKEKLENDGWRESSYDMTQSVIWKKKAIALDDLMNEGELGDFYGAAKNLLDVADEYIRGFQHSTPAGAALEAALEESLKGGRQRSVCLMVAVDRQHQFYLVEKLLANRFGAEHKIKVCLAWELPTLEVDSATELICLFSNHASIRHLFMLHQTPRSGQIIIGHSWAGKVMELLNVILDIAEYEKFHPLARRLLIQIKKGLVDIAISSIPDGSIDWDQNLEDSSIFDLSSLYGNQREKVIVCFAEHPPELFSPRSTVFLLDRDSSWGYRSETARNLEKGDILLVIPQSVTDQIVERLEVVYADKSKEAKDYVLEYQNLVKRQMEIERQENNGICSPTKITRKINEQAQPKKPVKPNNVRYWIKSEDIEKSVTTTLIPYAPENWEHFKAFSIYLGLPEFLARKVFVHILMIRRHNQQEGRRSRKEVLAILADEYSYHNSEIYPPDFIQEVRKQAERHSFQIQQVFMPEILETDTWDTYNDE